MRQLIFITLMLCTISITSCKKESSGDHPNEEVMLRINNWLDSQKPVNKPYKTEYIDLLKENIEPVNIRIENLGNGEKFLIVPVKEKFKTLKKLEMNSVINLLLVIDEAGKIRRGNVCQYFPKQQGSAQTIPVNTFYKLYNNKELDCDGSFRFLSVTGRRLYQYDYESGKLKSMGIVKPKTNSADNAAGRINTCWEWYYVTTYFNSDGEVIDETWQYLGTTCDGDDCQDQNNAMLCPDSETGSGGGTGDSGEACCVNDPNIQFTSEQSNIHQDICSPESINPLTGNPVKSCTHTWVFDRWSALWFHWKFIAVINTDLEKEGGIWKFKKATFQGVTRDGQLPYCVSSECTVNYANTTIFAESTRVKLILTYTISNRVTCYSWWSPNNVTTSISYDWPAPY